METKITEIMNPHKLHDKLFKKEQVSPIEVIYNSFSNLGYNVVRRPAGQCLGNLRYFNLFYDKHTHHFYQKNRKLRYDVCFNRRGFNQIYEENSFQDSAVFVQESA